MSTLTVDTQFTLLESLRREAPDGSPLKIAQVIDKVNDIIKIMPYFEANGTNEHKEAETKSEPSGEYTDYNEGTGRAASTTGANKFRIAKLDQFNTPDKNLIDDSVDPMGKRMQEASATIKGMTKTHVTTTIYGDSAADSKKFTGISKYLDALSQSNVVDGGGDGSNVTSIYAIAPGEDTVFYVYPRGNPSFGVEHEDMGTDIITQTGSKDLRVYRDYFKVSAGLVVKDRRALGRYANIETTGAVNLFDEDKIIDLHYQMAEFSDSIFYLCNRTMLAQIHKRMKDKNNAHLGWIEVFGKPVIALLGRPILLVDNIVNTEEAIT